MLTRLIRYLLLAGEPATLTWVAEALGGIGPSNCRLVAHSALEMDVGTEEIVWTEADTFSKLENGNPEEVIPVLYHLHRLYDGDLTTATDDLLCSYFNSSMGLKEPRLIWTLFRSSFPVTFVDPASFKPKKVPETLLISEKKDQTRVALLPCAELLGMMFVALREKDSLYHGN